MNSAVLEGLPLTCETSEEWAPLALANLDHVLRDHAWCEYKAASAGLGLMARFPEHEFLHRPMVSLVQEEMLHFRRWSKYIPILASVFASIYKESTKFQLLSKKMLNRLS